jgi:type VI protein secretion system component VasK
MKSLLRILFLTIALITLEQPLYAQKKKQTNQVTPQNAQKKKKENVEQKQAQYQDGKKAHVTRQDKATQKRMKKNLKRAQKHSWGKDIPWYKRWFRKSKV